MNITSTISNLLINIPWPELIGNSIKYAGKLLRGYSQEGMYKVLDYESTLEILDDKGKNAKFSKQKKVKYLQDNTIVYQDCAWGDGKILINYKTNIGKPVDQYQSGYKTIVLLSLHEIKNKGDVDDFYINWEIMDGFKKKEEFWETHVSQKTKNFCLNIIFPKNRKPLRMRIEESNRRRAHVLNRNHFTYLPDGRLKATWVTRNPRLYENYIIKWRW
jgi:hypothetical protein